MKISTAQLKQKAQGFIDAIKEVPSADRESPISVLLTEDYNGLRMLVAEISPDLSPLLPPAIELFAIQQRHMKPRNVGKATYNELNVFCQQLVNLLQ
jgi:hypothetical protein